MAHMPLATSRAQFLSSASPGCASVIWVLNRLDTYFDCVQKLSLDMPMQASICAPLNNTCCNWVYLLLALCTHRAGYRAAGLIKHLLQVHHLLLLA